MAKYDRRSIYVSKNIQRLLDSRDTGNVSACLDAAAERYMEICRRHCPKLALNEWEFLFGALQGFEYAGNAGVMGTVGIAAAAQDYLQLEKADVKHKVNGRAILEKLSTMSFAEKISIIDAAERFGALEDPGVSDVIPAGLILE